MKYEVIVQLKKEVLDAEGRAIRESLRRLGYNGLEDVGVTRRFVLNLDGDDTGKVAGEIAEKFLANPVSETYSLRPLEEN